MVELIFVFFLRGLQTLVMSMPTLLAGMLTAGVLAAVVGRQRITKWLGASTTGSRLVALAMSLTMPVCSIGVWPVLFVLRGLGASWGSVAVVAIAAPIVTPLSMGYLFDRCEPRLALAVLGANAAIALLAGWVVDRFARVGSDSATTIQAGSGLSALLRSAGRSLDARVLGLIVLASIGSGLVALMIPPNALGDMLVERSSQNAALIPLAGLFSYATPDILAMRAGEVASASTMPGLLVMLIAVAGVVNLGTLVLCVTSLGSKACVSAIAWVLTLAIVLTVALDRAVFDPTFHPEDTHAFEDVGQPFHMLDHPAGPMTGFFDRMGRPIDRSAYVAMLAIVGLVVLAKIPRRSNETVKPAPTGALLACGGAWLAIATVAIVYSYWPSPGLLNDQLGRYAGEFFSATRTGDTAEASRVARQIERRLDQVPLSHRLYLQTLPPEWRFARDQLGPLDPTRRDDDLLTRLTRLTRLIDSD